MALGHAARLFSVILKVGLYIHIRVVTDDFDGILIGAHGPVRAKSPEFTADRALWDDIQLLAVRNGVVGHIIHNTDGVMISWLLCSHVLIHGHYLGRCGVLAGKAEAARIGLDGASRILKHAADFLKQRLAHGSGFLIPVKDRNLLHGIRQFMEEMLRAEGTEQMNLQIPHLLPLGYQVVNGLLDGSRHAAHTHQDCLCFRTSVVVKQLIVSARKLINLIHAGFHHIRKGFIVRIRRFPLLKICIRVLPCGAQYRAFRVKRVIAELF